METLLAGKHKVFLQTIHTCFNRIHYQQKSKAKCSGISYPCKCCKYPCKYPVVCSV